MSDIKMPLLLIGDAPCEKLIAAHEQSPYKKDIFFKSGVADETVKLLYASASVFLFPSIAEGFGWPIAEAMASGCPVITTNEAPMSEVSGVAGFEINRRPLNNEDAILWARASAKVVERVINLSGFDRDKVIENGLMNVKRFDSETTLNKIEEIYLDILQSYQL
jgi:glycosyltransferase involved in cell wall biosynthesis